ncbi:MAG: MBL fold metallo-hydrolase [Candidatus Sericytochromatia bacterium]|nr:MBL fold metallo-hydrolase [Candidatus Sericytochromatia bacterium]
MTAPVPDPETLTAPVSLSLSATRPRWWHWLGAGCLSLGLPAFGLEWWLAAPTYPGPISDHFDGAVFSNLAPFPPRNPMDLLRWRLSSDSKPWPEWVPLAPGRRVPPKRSHSLRITFINHATTLIQLDGINLLTDPVYSERVGPFGWLGPARHQAPGVPFEALPPIDAVLVSHSHYDHMDLATIARLQERDQPIVMAGLGTRGLFQKQGLPHARLVELDWWQTHPVRGVQITFTPAQHWSARALRDRRRMLWGSFMVSGVRQQAYFAGDTGAGPHFKLIRDRLGQPDVALLPIGAYEPRWFMKPQHLNPDDAVEAHRALAAESSIGIHWGTFKLSGEGLRQPVDDLRKACQARGISPTSFRVLEHGEGLSWAPR